MAANILPDLDILRQLFRYEPDTGDLIRLPRPRSHFKSDHDWRRWNTIYANKPHNKKTGYRYSVIGIGESGFYVHRIAFKMHYGIEPPAVIDHVNGDGRDNRIANLRGATQSQNMMNKTHQRDSKTRMKGVSLIRGTNLYAARIRANGRYLGLGRFDTPEKAYAAYCDAAIRLHGEFAKF